MEDKVSLVKRRKCIGCLACFAVCPVNAIKKTIGDDGHIYAEIIHEKCIRCHKCENICSQIHRNYGCNKLKSSIMGGFSKNSALSAGSTSGGVFSALAYKVISEGGCVAGAYFDGRRCYHSVIDRTEDINLLQGSKYVASSMEKIYKQMEERLSLGKVLFSGLPCQCAAIISFFEKSDCFDNLYVVDLVCGGVPSDLLVDKFFEHNKNVDSIKSFRCKEKYELSYNLKGGQLRKSDKELPISGFAYEQTNRYCCYKCKYAKITRPTDITIGDLWGYKNGSKSVVVVHNSKGLELIKDSDIELFEVNVERTLKNNRRLYYGRQPVLLARRLLHYNFSKLNYMELLKVYGYVYPKISVIYIIRKLYRGLMYRLFKIHSSLILSNIIGGATNRNKSDEYNKNKIGN